MKLYYNENNKKNKIIFNDWYIESDGWHLFHTFNLGTNNPINYKKIMFLGEKSDFFSKISWGEEAYYGTKLSYFNDSEVSKKIINAKIIDPNYDVPHYINNENRFIVQSFQSPGFPYLKAVQEFALTWYYENNNFYIQILSYHWISVTGSYVYGGAWQGIGKGIKLYNI